MPIVKYVTVESQNVKGQNVKGQNVRKIQNSFLVFAILLFSM